MPIAYCGATLIDPIYLLTSESCFNRPDLGRAQFGKAIAGIYSLLERPERWQKRRIVNTCTMANLQPPPPPHNAQNNSATIQEPQIPSDEPPTPTPTQPPPQPAPPRGHNNKREDVLLVELDKPLEYSKRVQPVCLIDPLSSWKFEENENTTFAMAGLGVTSADSEDPLPAAYVNRLLLRKCPVDSSPPPPPSEDLICLGPMGDLQLAGNPCEGDQGNGAFLSVGPDRVLLAAILSQPASACSVTAERPALFSQLSSLQNELDLLFAGCVNKTAQRRRKLVIHKRRNHKKHRTRSNSQDWVPIEHLTIERQDRDV